MTNSSNKVVNNAMFSYVQYITASIEEGHVCIAFANQMNYNVAASVTGKFGSRYKPMCIEGIARLIYHYLLSFFCYI